MASESLVTVHYSNDETHLEEVKRRVLAAYSVGDAAPEARPIVVERLESANTPPTPPTNDALS